MAKEWDSKRRSGRSRTLTAKNQTDPEFLQALRLSDRIEGQFVALLFDQMKGETGLNHLLKKEAGAQKMTMFLRGFVRRLTMEKCRQIMLPEASLKPIGLIGESINKNSAMGIALEKRMRNLQLSTLSVAKQKYRKKERTPHLIAACVEAEKTFSSHEPSFVSALFNTETIKAEFKEISPLTVASVEKTLQRAALKAIPGVIRKRNPAKPSVKGVDTFPDE